MLRRWSQLGLYTSLRDILKEKIGQPEKRKQSSMSQFDFAFQEAEERLTHLEKDCEKLDLLAREKVKTLYANYILSQENSTVDHTMLLEKHHQLFEEFFEFRLGVEKLIGREKLTELFGSEAEIASLYQSQQHDLRNSSNIK